MIFKNSGTTEDSQIFSVGDLLEGYSEDINSIHLGATSLSPDDIIETYFMKNGQILPGTIELLEEHKKKHKHVIFQYSKEGIYSSLGETEPYGVSSSSTRDSIRNGFVAFVQNEFKCVQEHRPRVSYIKGHIPVQYIIDTLTRLRDNSSLISEYSFK